MAHRLPLPRRIRPGVGSLGRRMTKKGTLPRINPAVGSYHHAICEAIAAGGVERAGDLGGTARPRLPQRRGRKALHTGDSGLIGGGLPVRR
ncbi:hypothetical protein [Streptomyces sp. NPDC051636]|uniref:hypothetical protein n=1 Tax=Streptomyces sp. NPDC051636 TaxID=3365663 RepID=UPI00379599C4